MSAFSLSQSYLRFLCQGSWRRRGKLVGNELRGCRGNVARWERFVTPTRTAVATLEGRSGARSAPWHLVQIRHPTDEVVCGASTL